MEKNKNILIVEDEPITAKYYHKILEHLQYNIDTASNGLQAMEFLKEKFYDVIITDWLMPKVNGLNLIKTIRNDFEVQPLILMITTLSSEMSKNMAMDSGADEFLTKPINNHLLISTITNLIKRQEFDSKIDISIDEKDINKQKPEFIACGIASSTGGPPTLIKLFENVKFTKLASFFIVQHGPEWMFHTFQKRLQGITPYKVELTDDDLEIQPGHIYIARGNYHTIIDSKTLKFKLLDTEPINYVKPSADPLLQSIAQSFGEFSLAIILTGLGSDGTKGAMNIHQLGGKILIQDISEAIAPSMPRSVIKNGLPHTAKSINEMPEFLENYFEMKAKKLNFK